MKKIFRNCISVFALVALLGTAVACGEEPSDQTPDDPYAGNQNPAVPEETFEQKTLEGIPAAFDESQGYYNESPSVIEVDGVRYLYYTRNTVKNNNTTDSIAVRKGTYTEDGWTWGECKTLLTVSASGWDSKAVFGADVVKGNFSYQGESYSYLMAYSGSAQSKKRMHAQIGLAVSKTPDGEFVKVGTSPVVTFDVMDYDETGLGIAEYRGATEPSLVSYDKQGKVFLFYTLYEKYNGSYVVGLDAGNLDALSVTGRKALPTSGFSDMGATNPQLYCADYAYDPESNTFLAVRNVSTTVTSEPVVSQAVQLLSASAEILSENNPDWLPEDEMKVWWQTGTSVDNFKTATDDTFGYNRIFNACIASDEYGEILEYGVYDIYFTSQKEYTADAPTEYLYSQMIHEIQVRQS